MIECKNVAEEASNYLEGQLPIRKKVTLFLHLIYCKCCRYYIQQMRQTISTIMILRPKEKQTTDISHLASYLHQLSKNMKKQNLF